MSTTHDLGLTIRQVTMAVGSDPERYRREKHRKPSKQDAVAISSELGVGLGYETRKQQIMDAIMIRLGRDHRTGAAYWDASDWEAIHEAIVDG